MTVLTAGGRAQRRTFRSSDLSRHAPEVFAAAEDNPVDVTRRDGEDLVLMSKRESNAREQLMHLATQLIGAATDERGSIAERVAERLPWMLALSDADRAACADDLLKAARASLETGQANLAIAELTSWRETATAIAAGLGGAAPVDWYDAPITVEHP